MKNTFIYNNYLEAQKVLSTLEKELEHVMSLSLV